MTDVFQYVSDYLHAGKEAIDLFRTAYTLLPKGEERDEIERKVNLASEAMKRSDAALAQKLGYNLCQCQFSAEHNALAREAVRICLPERRMRQNRCSQAIQPRSVASDR
jgi:hypothetical protein